MRWPWRGIAVLGAATAVLCVPVASAWAPGPVDRPGVPAEPGPFGVDVQVAGRTLQDPALSELSGLAASRRHPGVLYGINDSGNDPVVFAIGLDGGTVARLSLDGASNTDWEALAPAVDGDGSPVLWVGDIGDNTGSRSSIRIIRIPEPTELVDQESGWDEYRLTYPDGPHDAEALAVHPADGSLWVITKGKDGPGAVYQVPADLRKDRANKMTLVMAAPAGITDGAWELSPTGEPRLVLTDYWRLHLLRGEDWVSALGPLQLQREALAWPWLPEGQPNASVLLGSEGTRSAIVVGQAPEAP